jgi:hypothetical protein
MNLCAMSIATIKTTLKTGISSMGIKRTKTTMLKNLYVMNNDKCETQRPYVKAK